MNFYIGGLSSYYDQNNETIYFFTDRMRKDDILFKLENDYLSVLILDKTNAQEFFMISDTSEISPIQMRIILKDIFMLQKSNDKETFTEMMKELSEQYTMSKGQLKEHADRLFSTMVWEFTLIETMVEGLEGDSDDKISDLDKTPQ